MADQPIDFVSEFAKATDQDWREAVSKTVRPEDFDRKLVRRTLEGIDVQPLYTASDTTAPGRAPATSGRAGSWQVRQEIRVADPERCREHVADELEGGGDAVHIVLDRAFGAGKDADQSDLCGVGGLSITSPYDLARAVGPADLAKTEITLDGGPNALTALAMLVAVARRERHAASELSGCVGGDPIDHLLATGSLPADAYDQIAAATRWCAANAPNIRTWCASAEAIHRAGADAVSELAAACSSAVETLRRLDALGVDAACAAPFVEFRFHTAGDLFTEVAKVRALRRMWARILDACGADESLAGHAAVHCSGSPRTRTTRDPWVNMLRGASECFSAIVGGATSISVTPFDDALGAPDPLARRLARNTQLVLRLESHLDAVADPAGGSWYVEHLTDALAELAWARFQEIEAAGGARQAALDGVFARLASDAHAARNKDVAKRKRPLTGVSSFADPTETPLDRPARGPSDASVVAAAARAAKERAAFSGHAPAGDAGSLAFAQSAIDAAIAGATVSQLATAADTVTSSPLPTVRDSAGFEALAERAAALDSRDVFMAAVGPLPTHKARASWVENFLAAATLLRTGDAAYDSADDAASAFAASGAKAAVIVGADAAYPELVPALAPALRAVGARRVLLAGRPKDPALTELIDEPIHVGCNVHDALERLVDAMEGTQ